MVCANADARRSFAISAHLVGLRPRPRNSAACFCWTSALACPRRQAASRTRSVPYKPSSVEPGWTVTGAFAHMWDCRFISFRVWQACKRRELYKENWIDWTELEKAEKIEAVGFLNEELKRATLTIAVP